jgi:hypothetical protein
VRKRIAKSIARLPPRRRRQLAMRTTRALLTQNGLRPSKVTVTSDGAVVTATVPARAACTATPATEQRMATAIRRSLPWVRRTRFVVGDSGQRLASYVRAQCRPVALPPGRGRVLMTQRGAGVANTRVFTTRSRRWTVQYVNRGTILHVLVMKGRSPLHTPVMATKPGAGRGVVTGAGRFRLRIAGAGEWVVRVRDGA